MYGKLRTYHSLYLNVQPAGKTLLSLINYIYKGVSCKYVTKWGNSQIIDDGNHQRGNQVILDDMQIGTLVS